MQEFYRCELARTKTRMKDLDPSSEEYNRALFVCERLATLLRYENEFDLVKGEEQVPGQVTMDDLVTENPVEDLPAAEEPAEAEEPSLPEEPTPEEDTVPDETAAEQEAEEEDETKSVELTKEYVRSLLRDATSRGITIAPILRQFVPEGKPFKFSEVPASRYAELVEVLKDA